MIKFTIFLSPVTKKNHSNIITVKGKPMLIPSKQYKQYEKDAGYFLKPLNINYPVNVKALYYLPTRRKTDLNNLHSALHDVLVKHKVVEDDNYTIIVSTDGSRCYWDKDNPRTEIEITEVNE
jgi:Holliday junction resolvase RusA-like endonuclease